MGSHRIHKTPEKTNFILAGSLAVVTFLVFLPALQNDFVNYDDLHYVVENPNIRTLNPAFLKWAFIDSQAIMWHPLAWLSHALDYAVWGINPSGHHLSSIVLHGVNTALVFWLVMRLIESGGRSGSGPVNLAMAAITALLFGLHPLRVESVVWISERKDVLSAFFYLLSLLAYLKYVRTSEETRQYSLTRFLNRGYFYCLGFAVLALLSKLMAVTLPLVMLILDWYPLGRFGRGEGLKYLVVEKLPLIVLSLLLTIITVMPNNFEAVSDVSIAGVWTKCLIACSALVFYVGKMIWPRDLIPLYPYPQDVSFLTYQYFIPFLLVIAITAGCVYLSGKRKLFLAAWCYYLITLLPVIGLIRIGPHSVADRYTYLPSLGPFLVIGLITTRVYEKLTGQSVRAKVLSSFIVLAMFISISYATIRQIGVWKDSIVLWNYVLEKNPGDWVAHFNLGLAYRFKGLLDKSIEQYKTTVRLQPGYVETYANLCEAYRAKGSLDMAIRQCKTALWIEPDYAQAHFNLGLVYIDNGLTDMARAEFELGLKISPNDYRARQILNSLISK
ncbi:MAG TPA: tetratricopeptide repeat protein [Thermodesulfovibrionales bacterium]|nr:tetratricopeptide repeat protein [Thermodesulfovibrionales bacterium]